MPDISAAQAATVASDTKSAWPVNTDRVGEELADDATVWHVYDRVSKEDDERRTKAWDNGLNNLALFAGLFSAVTTAFIIEAQQDLEPDYAQLAFLVLNATASGDKFVQQPFVVPSSARTVNCLWISSLLLSLSAALIAIMGKDWIGMYTARPACNLRQWAEMRTYRLRCVERWYMSGVIAAAPVLLHVSLILFGAGLVVFISSDPLTHHLTLGLSLAAGVLYLATTLSAVVFSANPFKSPATQMLRAAISVFFLHLRSVLYQPKRSVLDSLPRDTIELSGGRNDVSVFLADDQPQAARRLSLHALSAAGKTALAYVRSVLISMRKACATVRWSRVQSQSRFLSSTILRFPLRDIFLSSRWTDLPVERRPDLLAQSLSWLSTASAAPDVFRSIIFALGDLDIGRQVGLHISTALCTGLRTEIRRSWQQVDFLMLSRYDLADRNAPGDPVLSYHQFSRRFDLSSDTALRCEDGLAAVVIIDPSDISPYDLALYVPERVAQPRMPDFLLPYIQQSQHHLADNLILFSRMYAAHLRTSNTVNFDNLEAHLGRCLDGPSREAYYSAISVQYGGRAGAVELLTFLCCRGQIDNVPATKPAAVQLIMELLRIPPFREHRCLAYLFGGNEHTRAAWPDNPWSASSLTYLTRALEHSRRHVRRKNHARVQPHDEQFDIALARTAVLLLSPWFPSFEWEWIEFLLIQVSPSQSILSAEGQLAVIRLLLENGVLLKLVGPSASVQYNEKIVRCGTAILAAVIGAVGRRLAERDSDGEQLFGALAFCELAGPHRRDLIWDLGAWLRTQAQEILRTRPAAAAPMQDVHDALSAMYSLCAGSRALRALWDRIGYPGRPGDIFSDPFLALGDFFASAEDVASRQRIKCEPPAE